MPLSFQSISHGPIAFGFFNIESDLLLLEQYFIFATDFCDQVGMLAHSPRGGTIRKEWPAWEIPDRRQIGDLMGAIHGIRYTGFIGAVYRRYPFPPDPVDFKQNPQGACTRDAMVRLIEPYGREVDLGVTANDQSQQVEIGEYMFEAAVWRQLLDYVRRGGYPRWRDDLPPAYVRDMQQAAADAQMSLFGR